MKDFEALRSIWHDQTAPMKVGPDDIVKRVRRLRNTLANKLLLEIIGMSVATIALIIIWSQSPFTMWTTHLAMIIFTSCCLYYITALSINFRQIKHDHLLSEPGNYISYLKKYRHDRFIFNTRKYRNFSICFTVGFILYFIEVAYLAPLWLSIAGIMFTFAWVAVCYFVLMRSYIRREETRLNEMIENLERLEKQFSE